MTTTPIPLPASTGALVLLAEYQRVITAVHEAGIIPVSTAWNDPREGVVTRNAAITLTAHTDLCTVARIIGGEDAREAAQDAYDVILPYGTLTLGGWALHMAGGAR